ncbi:MAG: hypothetical protein KatS3mg031_2905 [Chitinophagales bacterium]|nr:MAG: hypothetical protein KatS3mg031_2905 [Chitinophagales bacterium]
MSASPDGKAIRFNYFRAGELINYKDRIQLEGGKKTFRQHPGAEKILYNLDSLQGRKKAIITEGEIDALSFISAGAERRGFAVLSVDQGAPAPGAQAGGKLECLRNCAQELDAVEAFYLCCDNDEPGRALFEELVRRLGAHRCYEVQLPEWAKDANDVLSRKELSLELRYESLLLALEQAKPVDMPGIVELNADILEDIFEIYEKGIKKGQTTGFAILDEHFTFLPGDLTIVTGIPGHGKSQFLRHIMLNKAVGAGWRWACYVPEDWPADYWFADLAITYTGKPLHGEGRMSEQELLQALEFISEHFIAIYPEQDKEGNIELPTNEWLNNAIRFAKLKYGVNAYVKDPWNRIYHEFGEREDRYLAEQLSKENIFAKEFDAAIIVAHPTKMSNITTPHAYNISGGAMWYNMADNIISVFRDIESGENATNVAVLKVRKQRQVGKPGTVKFYFDERSLRYCEDREMTKQGVTLRCAGVLESCVIKWSLRACAFLIEVQ